MKDAYDGTVEKLRNDNENLKKELQQLQHKTMKIEASLASVLHKILV